MARCCGSTGTCACKMEAGRMTTLTGTGTAQDPFVIGSDLALSAQDTTSFNIGLSGSGTLESPWLLTVSYADTATVQDIPNVNIVDDPPNGWVMGWDGTNDEWIAVPPTSASPGVITHGNGITGDGSGGSPLTAVGNAARYISITASGIGLSDAGINRLIRVFSNEAARTAASPVPVTNTLSILQTNPSVIEWYDGTDWFPVTGGIGLDIGPGQMLSLSGAYVDGAPTTKYVAQLSTTTDSTGAFVAIPSAALADYSGVLSCVVQPTGTVGWHCTLHAAGGVISGTARRLDTGAVYTGLSITGVVDALLY